MTDADGLYASLDEKPYDSRYFVQDIVIDRPPEAVWPFAVRISDWMRKHDIVTLVGEAGEVGHFERVFPRDLADGSPGPHRHHVYGVAALIPHRYIALEVLPERGGSYGVTRPWMSFDGISLVDRGDGTTTVSFVQVDVRLGRDPDGPSGESAGEVVDEDVVRAQVRGHLEVLRSQVEAAGS